MRRFFITPSAVSEDNVVITGPEAHHLHSVLRLKSGEKIILFDGTGWTCSAKIEDISQNAVHCSILSTDTAKQSGPSLHLGQALLTGSKMDLICQKSTELGISTIQPFVSKRCTVNKKSEKQISRWQRIILEACKQCGQFIIPEVLPPMALSKLFEKTEHYDYKFIFYEEMEQTKELNDLFAEEKKSTMPDSIFFLIGPEGGFTEDEVNQAQKAGFIPVSLGRLILRAETASISATAILQYLLGNLRHK